MSTTDSNTVTTTTATATTAPTTTTAISTTAPKHKLSSTWSWYYYNSNDVLKEKKETPQPDQNFEKNLVKLGSFDSIESFWSYFTHVHRPNRLPKLSNYYVFRDGSKPLWEEFPKGGSWIIKLKKQKQDSLFLNRLWEQLLFALIGEEFDEPEEVVGVVLGIRNQEDILAIWNKDNQQNPNVKFKIGEKLKEVLHLGQNTILEYKNNSESLVDKHTFTNAKQTYRVIDDNSTSTTSLDDSNNQNNNNQKKKKNNNNRNNKKQDQSQQNEKKENNNNKKNNNNNRNKGNKGNSKQEGSSATASPTNVDATPAPAPAPAVTATAAAN